MSVNYWIDVTNARGRRDFVAYEQLLTAAGKHGIRIDNDLNDALRERWKKLARRLTRKINHSFRVFERNWISLANAIKLCVRAGERLPNHFDERYAAPRVFTRASLTDLGERQLLLHDAAIVTTVLDVLSAVQSLRVSHKTKRHTYEVNAINGSSTGRPAYYGYLFGKHRYLRHLVVPERKNDVLLSYDAVAMDIGSAAGLSEDPTLSEFYLSGDPYSRFEEAIMASPAGKFLRHLERQRNAWKRAMLSIGYGITPAGLSSQLRTSPQVAQEILCEHTRMFPVYWNFVRRTVNSAYRNGYICSPSGFVCHVPTYSFEATWQAWPFQAIAADICRQGYLNLHEAGVPILATNHDAFYFSVDRDEVDYMKHVISSALDSARHRFMPNLKLRWKVTEYPDRIHDGADDPVWQLLMGACTHE